MTTTEPAAATTTEPTTTTTEPATPPAAATTTTTTEPTDLAAEVEKWKSLSKKNEDRAKQNAAAAAELDKLKQSAMSDTEKAVAQAKADARTEALKEVGAKLASAEIRVAAAGRNVDVDALLEGVDAAKFLDENGDPNKAAISAWVDKVAPAGTPAKRDLGLGVREGGTPAAGPAQDWAKFVTRQLDQTG